LRVVYEERLFVLRNEFAARDAVDAVPHLRYLTVEPAARLVDRLTCLEDDDLRFAAAAEHYGRRAVPDAVRVLTIDDQYRADGNPVLAAHFAYHQCRHVTVPDV